MALAVEQVHHCARCHTFTEAEVCAVCLDPARDATRLCVVETPADQAALERSGGKVFGPDGAARMLNMKPTTLASRIKALGIR